MRLNDVICRIRAEIDGTKYELGPIKGSEAEKITAWTGYSLREWEVAVVGEDDILAAKALIALTRFRTGEHVKIDQVEIEDVDTIKADFYDEHGRVVTAKVDTDSGKPVLVGGKPVLLFDGEESETPTPAASLTD